MYKLDEIKNEGYFTIINLENGEEVMKISKRNNTRKKVLEMFPEIVCGVYHEDLNEGRLIKTDYGWKDKETGIEYATEEEFYEAIKED